MGFDRAFHAAATYASPDKLDNFRRHINPDWVEEALAATGTATVRRRRLPAEQVIWVVLGMGLFRDRPIEDVVSKLDLALPGKKGDTVARSSVSQARDRLGSEPLAWLFDRCAKTWARRSAEEHRWRGLALYGMDGSTVRVPDTDENRKKFGGQNARNATKSGYPTVRIDVLMVLRSHLLAGACFGAYGGPTRDGVSRKDREARAHPHSLRRGVAPHSRRVGMAGGYKPRCDPETTGHDAA